MLVKNLFFRIQLVVAAVAVALVTASCRRNDTPVKFELTVPEENTVQFAAELRARYGLALDGEFPIREYGSVFVAPETASSGFRFGFQLHTSVFHHDTWLNYREVSALPTGLSFPAWMSGPVVDVEIPPLNRPAADWHFYFGTRGQYYVGVASVIRAVNQNFPGVNIGYAFYDKEGRVVMGLQFFGPKVASNGSLLVPGGIFVGTNLTPFLPEDFQPAHPGELDGVAERNQVVSYGANGLRRRSMALQHQAIGLVERANRGEEVRINGRTVFGEVRVTGRDQRRYRTEKRVKQAISRFAAASRSAN